MSNSAYSSPARTDSGMSKRPSVKWSEEEQRVLITAIADQPVDKINWADISRLLPYRTGKQCREKWKNDLRPDINKDPWTSQEEYILARMHAEVGNQWAEIAKYLQGRSENSIKNHWNATLRSKASAKGRTLLGTYGRLVFEKKNTSIETLELAKEMYSKISGAEPLDMVMPPEDFFARRPSQASVNSTPVKVKIGAGAVRQPAGGSRRTSAGSLPPLAPAPRGGGSYGGYGGALPPQHQPHPGVPNLTAVHHPLDHEITATIKIAGGGLPPKAAAFSSGPTTGYGPAAMYNHAGGAPALPPYHPAYPRGGYHRAPPLAARRLPEFAPEYGTEYGVAAGRPSTGFCPGQHLSAPAMRQLNDLEKQQACVLGGLDEHDVGPGAFAGTDLALTAGMDVGIEDWTDADMQLLRDLAGENDGLGGGGGCMHGGGLSPLLVAPSAARAKGAYQFGGFGDAADAPVGLHCGDAGGLPPAHPRATIDYNERAAGVLHGFGHAKHAGGDAPGLMPADAAALAWALPGHRAGEYDMAAALDQGCA